MALIKVLVPIILAIVLLYIFIIIDLKRKLKRLTERFGGEVSSKIIGVDYTFDDIELTYQFGNEYSYGTTDIYVTTKPKKPIKLSISPKLNFTFVDINKFEEIYEYKCITNGNFQILNDELKLFLVKNKKCNIYLTINKDKFHLNTNISPFFIHRIEKCVEFLLLVRDRIKKYELDTEQTL